MNNEVVILIAEDDEGHAGLIRKNLVRAGIANEMLHFKDGQEIMDFLLRKGDGPKRKLGTAYVLLLDIHMPRLNGMEVLAQAKADPELRKIPIIMITTTDEPEDVEKCHALGCNNYIIKPIDYDSFMNAVRQLGLFLTIVEVPIIKGDNQAGRM
ncbi:MAG: response regulator [Syntrophales bacterium]